MTAATCRLRRGLGFAALVAAIGCVALPAVAATSSRDTMQKTIDDVLAVLRNASLDHEQRLDAIEAIAVERFDLYTMSRLVLSRAWKKFSDEQRERYITEFKEYLANNYGSRINRYDQEEVEIIDVRKEKRGDATVRTRIVGGEFEDARVDYRMREKDEGWLIIDVKIEGISMVSNFRDQFREVLSRGGPQHLIDKLREKNALGPAKEE